MLIESLVKKYESLAEEGKLGKPGWIQVGVSYALCINDEGEVTEVKSLKEEVPRGKKTVLRPKLLQVPAQAKKASNICPNFLCHNSAYFLGRAAGKKPARVTDCFLHARTFHRKLLEKVDSPAARAVCAYFTKWVPEDMDWMPCFDSCREDLEAGAANIVFSYNGTFVQDIPEIQRAWNEYYPEMGNGPMGTCMVSGEKCRIERIHPAIKGIKGAQTTGASLVSFNRPAFCSYGKEQGLNAPMSQYTAFAYTSALNYLISNKDNVFLLGDITILFWQEGKEIEGAGIFRWFLSGSGGYTNEEMAEVFDGFRKGEGPFTVNGKTIDPDATFCVLGIAPNAARLSVRFFYKKTLRHFMEPVIHHYERMEIVRAPFDTNRYPSLWRTLSETVNQKLKDKDPLPFLTEEFAKSILVDARYPQALISGVYDRIMAEKNITGNRAAIIKAFYLKNKNPFVPEEVLTVELNNESKNIAYRLGRLFAVLERIQSQAEGPGLKASIKDRYFTGASQAPGSVFPSLVALSQHHLTKIGRKSEGLRILLDKDLTEILSCIDGFPTRLVQPQRGAFILGYYHQRQYMFKKKEEKEEKGN